MDDHHTKAEKTGTDRRSFLDLPHEIRKMVYDVYCVRRSETGQRVPLCKKLASESSDGSDFALLFVSKTIHKECIDIFYRANIFVHRIDRLPPAENIAPAVGRRIRELEVEIDQVPIVMLVCEENFKRMKGCPLANAGDYQIPIWSSIAQTFPRLERLTLMQPVGSAGFGLFMSYYLWKALGSVKPKITITVCVYVHKDHYGFCPCDESGRFSQYLLNGLIEKIPPSIKELHLCGSLYSSEVNDIDKYVIGQGLVYPEAHGESWTLQRVEKRDASETLCRCTPERVGPCCRSGEKIMYLVEQQEQARSRTA